MQQNIRTDKRHERLQQIGLTERIARIGKQKPIWVTRHSCEICATQWRHVDDPCDPHAGWSIERLPEHCA